MYLHKLFNSYLHKLFNSLLLATLTVFCAAASAQQVTAQSEDKRAQTVQDETNLDTQLYLIVGTNQESGNTRLPAILDPVVKQLRSTLAFKNYRLVATLINRVKNEGRLSLRWVGGPLALGAESPNTPSFSEFKVSSVKLVRDTGGPQVVRMENFSFGARIPIQTSSAVASNSPSAPIFNYESTGLSTDISMREGEPVVVGTLNIGPSGDAIILVVSAKRTGP
jgi:hypothetical protein